MRGRFGFGLLGLGLAVFAIAEIVILMWVANAIGWWTLVVLFGSAALGLYLMRREWGKARVALMDSARVGQLPTGRLADASLVVGGGLFLIVPGLLTDIIGLLCLLPFTRPFVREAITWIASRSLERQGIRPVIIDGEVVVDAPAPEAEILIPGITATGGVVDGEVVEGTLIDPEDK
ncbi:MAG: FxsA family protein [Tessaracoccus sp.]|uniref:FxsA family protein n=1 Tax=Tessaracoccus sp. TaxID=1971211 RepID=UPI001EBC83FD|nr:FxsA family protein [Tessaracoccus sp.]MBK7820256.1 FxsA family protein [Tessaracoccus sp.]